MKIGPRSIWLALVLLLPAAPGLAGETAARERLLSLKAALAGVQSVSGDFLQEKELVFLTGGPLVSRGAFHFARPDYLYWAYYGQPAEAVSTLELEGGRARAWSGPPERRRPRPDAARAARLAFSQMLMWMNMDAGAIEAAYLVTVLDEKPLKLRAVPRRAEARRYIEALEIEFSPDLLTVRRAVFSEPGKSRTTLSFSAVRLNQPRPVPAGEPRRP